MNERVVEAHQLIILKQDYFTKPDQQNRYYHHPLINSHRLSQEDDLHFPNLLPLFVSYQLLLEVA